MNWVRINNVLVNIERYSRFSKFDDCTSPTQYNYQILGDGEFLNEYICGFRAEPKEKDIAKENRDLAFEHLSQHLLAMEL